MQLGPDSDVIQLARRIKLHVATDLDQKYPMTFVADVTVQYRDGTSEHVFLDRATGRWNKPFTHEEQQAKLDDLTEGVIGKRQATELFGLIDRLDPAMPIKNVTSLLQWR